MLESPESRRVRFGHFELEPRCGELTDDGGRRQTLPEQPLALLKALLARPGQIVTRDELRHQLWRADTFVDFEHGLNAAVKRLRDALGDSADTPQFVETVPRRGYRFITRVQLSDVHESQTEGSSLGGSPAPAKAMTAGSTRNNVGFSVSRRRFVSLVVIAAGLVGLGFGLASRLRGREVANARTVDSRAVTRLPFGSGFDTDPVWSPDGRWIAAVEKPELHAGTRKLRIE